jgi:hypothetical protein
MASRSRTYAFWMFVEKRLQARRFFSVDISCSSVTNATFSLSTAADNEIVAEFSQFVNATTNISIFLQPQPAKPMLQLLSKPAAPGWHFLAVTFQNDSVSMYLDNSDYTFMRTNLSCLNLANANSASLESIPIGNSSGSLYFSQFRIFNGSFDPAYRGFVDQVAGASTNFRLTSDQDLSRTEFLSWDLNQCNCTQFSTYRSSSNRNAVLASSNGTVSVEFRSVPWLLPEMSSFSPKSGYRLFAMCFFWFYLTPNRFSRSKTNVLVQGFGFANSNFLQFSISSSDDITALFITSSKSFTFVDDFSIQLVAFERVS